MHSRSSQLLPEEMRDLDNSEHTHMLFMNKMHQLVGAYCFGFVECLKSSADSRSDYREVHLVKSDPISDCLSLERTALYDSVKKGKGKSMYI